MRAISTATMNLKIGSRIIEFVYQVSRENVTFLFKTPYHCAHYSLYLALYRSSATAASALSRGQQCALFAPFSRLYHVGYDLRVLVRVRWLRE